MSRSVMLLWKERIILWKHDISLRNKKELGITRQELDLSWTESEWFQTWLRLAREKHQDQPSPKVN